MFSITNVSSKGVPKKTVNFLPILSFADNLRVGMSKQSDGVTDAHGVLYPTNFNDASALGSVQTYLNNINTAYTGVFSADDNSYANNGIKVKVAEAFVNAYKRFKWLSYKIAQKVSQSTAGITNLNSSGQISLVKVIPIDSTRFCYLYQDTATNLGLNAVVGTKAADGTITFGNAVNIDTAFNSSGFSMQHASGCLINTDKIIVGLRTNSGTQLDCYVLTFSGSTITVGSVASRSLSAAAQSVSICKLATDKAMFVCDVNPNLQYWASTVSGSTITHGSTTSISSRANAVCIENGTDKAQILYNNSSQYCLIAVTWSGTTPTAGAEVGGSGTGHPIGINGSVGFGVSYGGQVGFGGGAIALLATDKFLLYMNDTTGVPMGVVITVSGTTTTINTVFNVTSPGTSNFVGFAYPVTQASDWIFYQSGRLVELTVSGTTVSQTTLTNNTAIWSGDGAFSSNNSQAVLIGSTVIYIGSGISTKTAVYYSAGLGSFEVYNDTAVSPITTITPTVQGVGGTANIDSALGGSKAYLKIKNISGSAMQFVITSVGMEVE